MAIRLVKVFLVLSVGLWGLIGTVGNLSGLAETYESVKQVTTMSGVPEGVGPPWRTASPIVVGAGVVAIVLGKLSALLGGAGGILMLKNVQSSPEDFDKSKPLAVVGCALAFALMFFSFMVVAESAFFIFYSPAAPAGELAFRYAASFALIALLVAQPEPGGSG